MDQLRVPTSPPPPTSGNRTPSNSQHRRPPSTPYGDLKHSSSHSGSYEFSQETKTFNEPSVSDDETVINPARASYNAAALAPRRIVTKENRWTPLTLQGKVASAMVVLMLATAAGIEVAFALAQKMNGFSVETLQKYGSPQFFASFLPVLCILPLVLYCLTVTHEVYRLQPYISASHGNAPPQQTVLVSYINQNRVFAALDALKNGHRMVVVVTVLSYITAMWQPLAATLFVVRQTNNFITNFDPILVTAELGVQPSFTDLDAFLAAAGYADAAVVHGLLDPPFVWGGWTVAPFEFPRQPKNATMALGAQAVFVDPQCETLSPQLNQNVDGSYTVTATRGQCVASFRANQTDDNHAFGVTRLDSCATNDPNTLLEDRFKSVVFWFFTFDGPTASMVFCAPKVETHLVNVNVSLSTRLIVAQPTIVKSDLPSNVTTGEPFNGLALNGLFFPESRNQFVNARATAVRSAIPNAIHKAAADNVRGMASSLRDIQGQLQRVTSVYTQYLTIAAKSNFFVPADSTTKPVIQSWMPRFWMDRFSSHVLAVLIIFIALSMSILQYVHRKERNKLYLAGPPGSIASDVSMTSSAKFGLLLNAGDTDKDMERKLRDMRFGIEHSTGQIIVEREDGGNSVLRYVPEDVRHPTEVAQYPKEVAQYPKEDVRASLLSDEAGGAPRDSFIGLRNEERGSYARSSLRTSVVGSLAPVVSSPLKSAGFSQTKFSSLPSPTPSTAAFSPPPAGTTTFASPPPSSTAARFSTVTTRYSAPSGPPPQRSSYHDPHAPNPA